MSSIGVAVIGICLGVVVGAVVTYSRPQRRAAGVAGAARLRELQLDLDSAVERIRDLEDALVRERTQRSEAGSSSRDDLLDDLANAVSQPAAFLAVQVSHAASGTSPELTVNDMAMTGTRILQALEAFEISMHGAPGDQTVFDPSYHTPVADQIEPGTPVVLCVPAVVGNHGRLVRRAVVEPR